MAASDRLTSWLRDVAWPFWLSHGIDRDGAGKATGFHEHLSLDDHRCTADFRRLRVVARQIYVFSKAAEAGVRGAEEAVSFGLLYLRRHAFAGGGYHWRFDLANFVLDSRRDLYDHAFVLLALSSAMRVLPSRILRDEALALHAYLGAAFPHPAGGFKESLPEVGPRRQNPHMHLLEACLAASETFGDDQFLARADAIVELFLDRLLQPEGALAEFFDDDLLPHREDGRFLVEPGHHSEWVWLLEWHGRRRQAAGRPLMPGTLLATRALTIFNDRHAVHAGTGGLMDRLWSDGGIQAAGQRLWPQTERLKAEIVRPDAAESPILRACTVLESYIEAAPPGLWSERRLPDGTFRRDPAPASSLYHLTSAITLAATTLASMELSDGGNGLGEQRAMTGDRV